MSRNPPMVIMYGTTDGGIKPAAKTVKPATQVSAKQELKKIVSTRPRFATVPVPAAIWVLSPNSPIKTSPKVEMNTVVKSTLNLLCFEQNDPKEESTTVFNKINILYR